MTILEWFGSWTLMLSMAPFNWEHGPAMLKDFALLAFVFYLRRHIVFIEQDDQDENFFTEPLKKMAIFFGSVVDSAHFKILSKQIKPKLNQESKVIKNSIIAISGLVVVSFFSFQSIGDKFQSDNRLAVPIYAAILFLTPNYRGFTLSSFVSILINLLYFIFSESPNFTLEILWLVSINIFFYIFKAHFFEYLPRQSKILNTNASIRPSFKILGTSQFWSQTLRKSASNVILIVFLYSVSHLLFNSKDEPTSDLKASRVRVERAPRKNTTIEQLSKLLAKGENGDFGDRLSVVLGEKKGASTSNSEIQEGEKQGQGQGQELAQNRNLNQRQLENQHGRQNDQKRTPTPEPEVSRMNEDFLDSYVGQPTKEGHVDNHHPAQGGQLPDFNNLDPSNPSNPSSNPSSRPIQTNLRDVANYKSNNKSIQGDANLKENETYSSKEGSGNSQNQAILNSGKSKGSSKGRMSETEAVPPNSSAVKSDESLPDHKASNSDSKNISEPSGVLDNSRGKDHTNDTKDNHSNLSKSNSNTPNRKIEENSKKWEARLESLMKLLTSLLKVAGVLGLLYYAMFKNKKPLSVDGGSEKEVLSLPKASRQRLRRYFRNLYNQKISFEDEVLKTYYGLEKLFEELHHGRPDSLPPIHYGLKLRGDLPILGTPFEPIASLFCKVFYGFEKPKLEEIKYLRQSVQQILKKIQID